MPYHLKAAESVPEAVKRIVREEIESAADQLGGKGETSRDEAIHEARKSIKKVRAVLRLMRPEIESVYTALNPRLRDEGRRLSEFRDAGVMIETLDALCEKYKDELGPSPFESVRRAFLRRKEDAEAQARVSGAMKRVTTNLRRAGKDVERWPLQTDGFPAIAQGLENTFRRGRKALALAQKQARPEDYHEWRKRVKDHWYHIRLLENVWTDVMQAYEKTLKDLETWLGEDHNLVVLHEKIVAEPRFYGRKKDLDTLLGLVGRFQKELRDNALSLGQRIYDEKPKQFTRRMKHIWDAWQTQPASLGGHPERRPRTQAGTAA